MSRTNLDWYLDMAESVQVSGNGLAKSHVSDLSKRMTEQQRDHQRGTDAQSVSFSSSPIMVGVSFDLPLAVQHAIPRDVQPDQIPRCPVVAYGLDHHVLFRPDGLFPHRLRPVALGEEVDERDVWVDVEPANKEVRPRWFVPRVGSYCRLVLPDQRRFTGRITRVVEYQQTRIVLWVEHPHSPASVTLAVPYAFFEGTRWWYIRLRSWLGWLRPDSDRHNSGKFSFAHTYKLESHASTVVGQSPNIDEWELDDHIQGEFQYLYAS